MHHPYSIQRRLLIPLLFCSLLATAQDSARIAQLNADLQKASADTQRIEALNLLFVEWRNYDSAKAMQSINDAIALTKKAGLAKRQSQLMLEKGKFLNINGENDEAEKLMLASLAMAQKNNDFATQAYALRSIGTTYYDKNNYQQALDYYVKATPLFEKAGDKKGLAGNYIWMGNVYNEGLHQTRDAIGYFQKSLSIVQAIPDSSLMSYNYNNIGQAYYIDKQYDSALQYYQESLELKRRMGDERGMGNALNNISNIYFDQGNYAPALLYNDSSLAIRTVQGDKKGMATSYLNGANIYLGQKNLAAALSFYNKALALGQETGFREAIYETYAGLSRYYEQAGDTRQALNYYRQYKALEDSVYNAGIAEQIATLKTKFETGQKEKQIQEQRFALTRKNYLLYGSGILLLLGGLLGYNYYQRFRLKKEKQLQEAVMHQQELATRAVMEAEENERRRIATELHDGVGQLMSAARMNLGALETEFATEAPEKKLKYEKIVSLVDESCKEVRTVSHSMMPNALLKKGLAAAVRDFIDKIDQQMLKVNLYAEGLNERIDANTETMVYRIVQECVNNVIKHSRANQLDISLINEKQELAITIEDNGIGFDARSSAPTEGIGLKNIQSRVAFLKGTIEWDSQPGRGTAVSIYIPVTSAG